MFECSRAFYSPKRFIVFQEREASMKGELIKVNRAVEEYMMQIRALEIENVALILKLETSFATHAEPAPRDVDCSRAHNFGVTEGFDIPQDALTIFSAIENDFSLSMRENDPAGKDIELDWNELEQLFVEWPPEVMEAPSTNKPTEQYSPCAVLDWEEARSKQ